jgi:hypothetical protein
MMRALLLSIFLGLVPLCAQAQNAWINEIHYDDSGGGSDFIEVVVEDASSVDLSKLDIELYRQDGDRYGSIGDIDSDFTEESTIENYTFYTWETTLQNGPDDGLALCFNDSPLQFLSYEGVVTATEDCADGNTSIDIGVAEDGGNANTTSLQLQGTGSTYEDFSWTGPLTSTKGNANSGQMLVASVITVDDDGDADFTTIQAAIDAASAGNVIEIAEGTYSGGLTIDKALTLQGVNSSAMSSTKMNPKSTPTCSASLPVVDASGSSTGLTVGADNVTLSTLCVTSAQTHNIYTDTTISDLTLDGIEALNAGNQGFEVHNDASVTTLAITSSTFSGNNIGLRIRGSVSGLDISDSHFDGNNFGFSTTHGDDTSGSTTVSGATIASSTFNNNPSKGIYVEKFEGTLDDITVTNSGTDATRNYPQAVDINLKYRTYSSVTVMNSTLESGNVIGAEGGGEALIVKARNDGSYSSNPATLDSLLVASNTLNNSRIGLSIGNNVQAATIRENLIQNNDNASAPVVNGIRNSGGLLFYANPTSGSYSVLTNCITGNAAYGLAGASTGATVAASGNYWGAGSGPSGDFVGSGDAVFGNVTVDFSPQSVAACPSGDPTPNCTATTLSESLDNPEDGLGVITATFSNPDGIEKIAFVDPDGDPFLNNLVASNSSSSFTSSDNGITWTPTSGTPQEAVFKLTQADSTVAAASYFAEATSVCSNPGSLVVDFDPVHTLQVGVPDKLMLGGNYPNPFDRQTTIEFTLPEPADVTLSVFDLMGRRVATLVEGRRAAGVHQVQWQGRGADDAVLASGLYLVRLTAGEHIRTDRLTIVR